MCSQFERAETSENASTHKHTHPIVTTIWRLEKTYTFRAKIRCLTRQANATDSHLIKTNERIDCLRQCIWFECQPNAICFTCNTQIWKKKFHTFHSCEICLIFHNTNREISRTPTSITQSTIHFYNNSVVFHCVCKCNFDSIVVISKLRTDSNLTFARHLQIWMLLGRIVIWI